MGALASQPFDASGNNLPVQPTLFIGRVQEVATACSLLQRDDVRLLTLTGPGGTGKTRLGIQVAGQLLHSFSDGVFFVALAPIGDPALVASTVAQALGVIEAGDKPLADSLKLYLRERRTLLVLDNFEQILDAAGMVADLLAACPYLNVLATSRERLRLRIEHEFPVPPLSMPDTSDLPTVEGLTQYEAVRLFIDRAVAIRPDFRIDNSNAPAVAEICARLDGLPLAIELAAARVKILQPDGILARLQNRLKLLTGGGRDLPARHQTLRGAIEWSYDLLEEAERLLFRRVSVFSGSYSLEAIEAVCCTGDIDLYCMDGVTSLMDKNLLRQAFGPDGEIRFVMLETIQEYAREKLEESGEADMQREAHAQYFLRVAEGAKPQLRGAGQVEWLKRLEVEHDNFRSALKWAIEQGNSTLALELGAALMQFWKVHGHITEGRAWLEGALAGSRHAARAAWAEALMAVGTLAVAQGDYLRARPALLEGLALFRELGDKANASVTLRNLAYEARLQGENTAAYAYMQEGMELARELGDRLEVAIILGDMGILAQTMEDLPAARAHYEESLAIRRELKDKRGIAMQLVNLGELARGMGDYEAANSLYQEGLAIARELGDRLGVGMVLHNLGHVALHSRRYAQAYDLFAESLRIFSEMHNKRDIAYCLSAIAGVYGAVRQPQRAAMLFSAAQVLFNTISSRLDPADLIEYERNLAATRLQLSPPDWGLAWEAGQRMSVDEAVAYALQRAPQLDQPSVTVLPRPKTTAPLNPLVTAPLPPGPLTTSPITTSNLNTGALGEEEGEGTGLSDREREVLRLVAMGLTDGQVAEQLFISPRTVHRHLSSIYSKLGVTTRTAAARLAVDHNII